jgi:hypothetical protein
VEIISSSWNVCCPVLPVAQRIPKLRGDPHLLLELLGGDQSHVDPRIAATKASVS